MGLFSNKKSITFDDYISTYSKIMSNRFEILGDNFEKKKKLEKELSKYLDSNNDDSKKKIINISQELIKLIGQNKLLSKWGTKQHKTLRHQLFKIDKSMGFMFNQKYKNTLLKEFKKDLEPNELTLVERFINEVQTHILNKHIGFTQYKENIDLLKETLKLQYELLLKIINTPSKENIEEYLNYTKIQNTNIINLVHREININSLKDLKQDFESKLKEINDILVDIIDLNSEIISDLKEELNPNLALLLLILSIYFASEFIIPAILYTILLFVDFENSTQYLQEILPRLIAIIPLTVTATKTLNHRKTYRLNIQEIKAMTADMELNKEHLKMLNKIFIN